MMSDSILVQCAGTMAGLLCQTLRSYPHDISLFWTSLSGCLTRLSIEVRANHLSACCASTAPLVALQQLELICSGPSTPAESANLPAQTIALSLPQLTCLSVPKVEHKVTLELACPKLQSLRLASMPRIVKLSVSAPSLTHLATRNIHMLAPDPANIPEDDEGFDDGTGSLTLLIASMSKLASLELQHVSCRHVWQHVMENLVQLTSLTRLVTRIDPAQVPSLPVSLEKLIAVAGDATGVAEILAGSWRLESVHIIARDKQGQLFNPEVDVPWGMGSVKECGQPDPQTCSRDLLRHLREAGAETSRYLDGKLMLTFSRQRGNI